MKTTESLITTGAHGTEAVKVEQGRRARVRTVDLARRVVGMYRLAAEQATVEQYNSMNIYVNEHLSDYRWRKFKGIFNDNLKKHILNDKKMAEIIEANSKDTGGLGDLVFDKEKVFPKQAMSIRIGHIMEISINEFLSDVFTPYAEELDESIKSIAGYNIQRDVSVRKGNTVVVAEVKYNYNLDTEKSRAMADKMDLLNIACKDSLKEKGLTPIICMVSLRYPNVNDVHKLKPALEGVRTQYMVGYSQFFNFFDIKVTKAMWDNLHAKFGKEVMDYFEDFTSRN